MLSPCSRESLPVTVLPTAARLLESELLPEMPKINNNGSDSLEREDESNVVGVNDDANTSSSKKTNNANVKGDNSQQFHVAIVY